MSASTIFTVNSVAPGRERATALRSFPDWPALPLSGFGIGALSPRRGGRVCDASRVTARGNVDRENWTGHRGGMASSRRHGGPVSFYFVQRLDSLPKGGTGLVVGEASAHTGVHRIGDAACHGAGRAGGAP
jgi:hypothetical protein